MEKSCVRLWRKQFSIIILGKDFKRKFFTKRLKYAIIVMVNVMAEMEENIMDRRFLEKEIEQLEAGKLYSSQWNGDFFFKEMRNDYIATFVKAIYAEEDALFENPLPSDEVMYATPHECKHEGWIR